MSVMAQHASNANPVPVPAVQQSAVPNRRAPDQAVGNAAQLPDEQQHREDDARQRQHELEAREIINKIYESRRITWLKEKDEFEKQKRQAYN